MEEPYANGESINSVVVSIGHKETCSAIELDRVPSTGVVGTLVGTGEGFVGAGGSFSGTAGLSR